jgi:hypothetical protein
MEVWKNGEMVYGVRDGDKVIGTISEYRGTYHLQGWDAQPPIRAMHNCVHDLSKEQAYSLLEIMVKLVQEYGYDKMNSTLFHLVELLPGGRNSIETIEEYQDISKIDTLEEFESTKGDFDRED